MWNRGVHIYLHVLEEPYVAIHSIVPANILRRYTIGRPFGQISSFPVELWMRCWDGELRGVHPHPWHGPVSASRAEGLSDSGKSGNSPYTLGGTVDTCISSTHLYVCTVTSFHLGSLWFDSCTAFEDSCMVWGRSSLVSRRTRVLGSGRGYMCASNDEIATLVSTFLSLV